MSAQILPFTPRRRETEPSMERDCGAMPAIVIFPGVRYERLTDETCEPAVPPAAAVPVQRH